MLTIYNGASICAYEQPFACGLRLQPHLKDVLDDETFVYLRSI